MAAKGFFKNFEDFKGLDLFASSLSRLDTAATDFENVDITSRKSVRKRDGHKLLAEPWVSAPADSRLEIFPIGKLTRFFYSKEGQGQAEETFGMGILPWKLAQGYLQITVPATGQVVFYPVDTGAGVFKYFLDCRIAGGSVGGVFPLDCGTGVEDLSSLVTLGYVTDSIQALGGGWAAKLFPRAVVDGNQVNRGHTAPVTVLNPHTLSVFRHPTVTLYNDGQSTTADLIKTTADTVTLKQPVAPGWLFDVLDGDEIGAGNAPAALLNITDVGGASYAGGTQDLYFYYWMPIHLEGDNLITIPSLDVKKWSSAKTLNNVLYFSTGKGARRAWDYYGSGGESGLIKYDGKAVYAAGMPSCPIPSVSAPVAGGALGVGRYRYLAEFVYIDEVGNEIHGNASDLLGIVEGITAGAALSFNVTVVNILPVLGSFNFREAKIVTGGVPVGPTTTIPTVAATNYLRVGDRIWFNDNAGALQYRTVMALTYNGGTGNVDVSISGDNVTVIDTGLSANISNILIRLWRTTVGGSFYYYLKDLPNNKLAANQVYLDTAADATLGEQWEGPYLMRDRRDLPLKCALLETHQGLLVGAKDPYNPDTVFWSSYESPEYWSRSANFQKILGSSAGEMTALASDSLDTLIVFRRTSFSLLSGDLYYGNFSLTSESKGDVGVDAQSAILRLRDALVFITPKGPRIISGGQVASYEDRLSSLFIGDEPIYLPETGTYERVRYHSVRAAFDNEADLKAYFEVQFSVPRLGFQVIHRRLVLDYQKGTWATYAYTEAIAARNDGMAMVGAFPAFLTGADYVGMSSGVVACLRQTSSADLTWLTMLPATVPAYLKYGFIDILQPIKARFRPQWLFLGEPSLNKTFATVQVWSIGRETNVPSPVTVKTYRNFSNAVVDSQQVLPFAEDTTIDGIADLVLNRAKALQVSFENDTAIESMHISGYEVEIAGSYKKEHLESKDK